MSESSAAKYDSLWYGFNLANPADNQLDLIEDAAIAVRNGNIEWVGARQEIDFSAQEQHDLNGGWVTPGLIDCHTHLVFGGNRANEFEMRLNGATYTEIAEAGGGIKSTVKATRQASEDQLFDLAYARLQQLIKSGVTTVEIKSGYGLDTETELKMLKVARRLEQALPVTIKTTCLAAHALPIEYADRADEYIDMLCDELLPAVAESGLADAVDAFCETIGFSPAQVERYFQTATKLGLPVKLHAEQLSALGGGALAASFKALSADHLEYATEQDVLAMSEAGTVAVLLPGAFYSLQETQKPPVELFRKHKVKMAVASDLNPGSSPALSTSLMMNMVCVQFGLTPSESLLGCTTHAAQALGIQNTHGKLQAGYKADFVCWDVESISELSYWLAGDHLKARVQAGKLS